MTGSQRPRRSTRQYAAITDALAAAQRFQSAQEIHAHLRTGDQPVGLTTVYRHLQALVADGVVDVLNVGDGEVRYRLCATDDHHHHLVCRSCGTSVEITGSAIERWSQQVAKEHGFSDIEHTAEVFGTCSACSVPRRRASSG